MAGDERWAACSRSGAALPLPDVLALALATGSGDMAAPAPAVAPPPDAPLTKRELEIAGLVAEGLSNREIAERLIIAKRTADSHVEHILAKLGFTSRAQIAAWAERRKS